MMQALKTLTEENPSQLSPDFHKQLFKQDKDFYLNCFVFFIILQLDDTVYLLYSQRVCVHGE